MLFIKTVVNGFFTFIALIFATPYIILGRLCKKDKYYQVSLFISLFPFGIGNMMRRMFYKYTLKHMGHNVVFKFGSYCLYRNIEIGNNALIGIYNQLGECSIGDNALLGSHINIVSGKNQHVLNREQENAFYSQGVREKILIGKNVWIGNNAIIMANVGDNCIIGAGSVVTKEIPDNIVCAGNPAKKL